MSVTKLIKAKRPDFLLNLCCTDRDVRGLWQTRTLSICHPSTSEDSLLSSPHGTRQFHYFSLCPSLTPPVFHLILCVVSHTHLNIFCSALMTLHYREGGRSQRGVDKHKTHPITLTNNTKTHTQTTHVQDNSHTQACLSTRAQVSVKCRDVWGWK